MALSRGRRYEAVNYWPGFVDALSTMLLVIIFLLSVFMLAQFFLSREVSGKDVVLARLNQQIELCRSLGDNGSRELLEGMLVSEEEHANWLEAQLALIDQVGVQNYLAQQVKD